jgi:hypothetical protein
MERTTEQGKRTLGWTMPAAATTLLVSMMLASERSASLLAGATEWLGDGRVLKLAAVANALTMIP